MRRRPLARKRSEEDRQADHEEDRSAGPEEDVEAVGCQAKSVREKKRWMTPVTTRTRARRKERRRCLRNLPRT
jgi:hypothetical protein